MGRKTGKIRSFVEDYLHNKEGVSASTLTFIKSVVCPLYHIFFIIVAFKKK
jgi:hypothetical protein